MAPPKRKTGGRVTPTSRVTPKGGRVDQRTGRAATHAKSGAAIADEDRGKAGVVSSRRYTPKADHSLDESPPWVPWLMVALFVIGGLAIMSRYLFFTDSNIPMIVGLVGLLGGLVTATRWR